MRILLLLVALLIASPAWAVNSWTGCGGGAPSNSRVGDQECKEFQFDSTWGGTTTFRVQTETALISLWPDILAAGGVATVDVQKCANGQTAAAQTCTTVLAGDLDGTGGAPATQTMSVRVGPGFYQLEVGVAAGAGDTGLIQVQGE